MPRAPPLISATFPASLMAVSFEHGATGAPAAPKPLLVAEDDGQTALVAEHDDLRVRALRQLMGDLDRLPLQELRADALGDDRLEVRDALGLDALAIRLLPLTVEHEAHPLRLLLGLKL